MHVIQFRLGLRPDPAGGAYSAPHIQELVFRRPTSKGEQGKGVEQEGKGKWEEMGNRTEWGKEKERLETGGGIP